MANKMRDAAKERFWRGVVKRFAASGLSVRVFCRDEKLAESAFYAWRRTIGQRDAEARRPTKARPAAATPASLPKRERPAKSPVFLPLLVSGNGHAHEASVTLELGGGRVLRLPEAMPAERLAEIVVALEAKAVPTGAAEAQQ